MLRRTALGVISILLPAVLAWSAERIVVEVNNAIITEQDVQDAVNIIVPRGTFHGTISRDRYNKFRDQAIESLIDFELQYQAAVEAGIRPSRREVTEQLKAFRTSFSIEDEYQAFLERRGWTEQTLEAKIRKNLIVRTAVERYVNGPSRMSEEELKEYYNANRSKFEQPESVRLRIFYTTDERKARDALNRVCAGEDFGEIAARMSEDNYRIKGGDLGYVHRGRIYPGLESAAFAMKVGEVSDLLHEKGGWFFLKVEDTRPARQIPFEEAKSTLQKDLERKKRAAVQQQWLATLRAKATIEIKKD